MYPDATPEQRRAGMWVGVVVFATLTLILAAIVIHAAVMRGLVE